MKALILSTKRIGHSEDYDLIYIGEAVYSQVPAKHTYIQIWNQNFVGYKVLEIIFLQEDQLDFEVLLVVGNAFTEIKAKDYYPLIRRLTYSAQAAKQRILNDQKLFENPDEKWQQKRDIYTRITSGEDAQDIAIDLGLSVLQVKRRSSDWRHLLFRVEQKG